MTEPYFGKSETVETDEIDIDIVGLEDFDTDEDEDEASEGLNNDASDEDMSDDEIEELAKYGDIRVPANKPSKGKEINYSGKADDGGAIINDDELMEEGTFTVVDNTNSFISPTGDIVVMDNADNGHNFSLEYIGIENIAIVRRIRKESNVDDLIKSIKSTGLLRPIEVAPTVTDGVFVLLGGYRRLLACARCGIRVVPCIINHRISSQEIPVIEAMYNHSKRYSVKEIISYAEYLETEKGVHTYALIEYLCQLNPGDYTKLKDILNDNDDEIVERMLSGQYDIGTAFRKLEARRKKESAEEREMQKASKVYDDSKEEEIGSILEKGEEAQEGLALTEAEIKELAIGVGDLDTGLEDTSLNEMVADSKKVEGFSDHKQNVGEREYLDPALRKAVIARDDSTCVCCRRKFLSDVIDIHHILPVFLGGVDSKDNSATTCLVCHRSIHLFAQGELYVPDEKKQAEIDAMTDEERIIYLDEQMRYKRIVRLGMVIRGGMVKRGLKREEYKKMHGAGKIGRNMPGHQQERA